MLSENRSIRQKGAPGCSQLAKEVLVPAVSTLTLATKALFEIAWNRLGRSTQYTQFSRSQKIHIYYQIKYFDFCRNVKRLQVSTNFRNLVY